MPFSLVPVEAYRVDISGVEDVQRERLSVTFEDGTVLLFGLMTRGPIGEYSPRLVLDYAANRAGKELQKKLVRRFYDEYVKPTLGLLSWLRGEKSPYRGWSWEKLHDRVEVTFKMGRDGGGGPWYAGHLQVGQALELQFGTRTSDKLRHDLYNLGVVKEIGTFVIPPEPVRSPHKLVASTS